ncbi:MAG: hypothetical protein EZS28_015498 [Streblomastix strix]|uniref:Serine/threonine specific protein phosphatases domain-containing protein n=1 Tax=Streblomastix strix TaxID=222440 RepID=A0A5J4W2U6_9EUKA|nr:MAG: hypothetical protein EZS28_015498 [Streblomastix strix]
MNNSQIDYPEEDNIQIKDESNTQELIQLQKEFKALKYSRRLGLASLPEVMHPFTDPPAPLQPCCIKCSRTGYIQINTTIDLQFDDTKKYSINSQVNGKNKDETDKSKLDYQIEYSGKDGWLSVLDVEQSRQHAQIEKAQQYHLFESQSNYAKDKLKISKIDISGNQDDEIDKIQAEERYKQGLLVVGDIHGNFSALLKVLAVVDEVLLLNSEKKGKVVFLGDYIDRGQHSLECVLLLLAYKLAFPSRIELIRGNHDDLQYSTTNFYPTSENFKRIVSVETQHSIDYNLDKFRESQIKQNKYIDDQQMSNDYLKLLYRKYYLQNEIFLKSIEEEKFKEQLLIQNEMKKMELEQTQQVVYGPDPFQKWREMAQVGPEGIQIQQGGEMNVQHGGVPQPTPGDESGAQQLQNARQTGKEWLQPFTNKGMSPEEEARRKEMMALGKAVLEGYYHVSLDKLDQTGERASEETRLEIRRREQMIRTLIYQDKAVKTLADDKDSQIELETQIFAVHACRIVAGDAQKRREVAVVPSSAKEALLTGGGLTLLLGSESKAIVAEALKSSKLIAAQQTTNIQQIADNKMQQVQQQQVPFMNTFKQNQRQFNNRKFGRRFSNFGASNNQFVPFNSQNNNGQWGNQWQQLPDWSQQANGWGTIQAGYNPNVSQMNQYQQQQYDNRSWQPGQKRGLNMAPTQLPKPPLENHAESDQQKNQ